MTHTNTVTPKELCQLVRDAHSRISASIIKTRVVPSPAMSSIVPCTLFFKMEQEQRTGSFKLRGAHSKLSKMTQREGDFLVTSSSGNHGLACIDAMKKYGLKGRIIVPRMVSAAKRKKLELAGADLLLHGNDCVETEMYGRKLALEKNEVMFIPPYNDTDIMAGQGTLGLEVLDQLPEVEVLVLSVGGGGLMAGVAAYAKTVNPLIQIVGCQPEASPVMLESVRAGRVVDWESQETLSEGSAGGIEEDTITFPLCRDLVDHWVVLSEDEIKWGVHYAWEHHGAVIEGAAGMPVAAVRKLSSLVQDKVVCAVLCGGNMDPDLHQKVVNEVRLGLTR